MAKSAGTQNRMKTKVTKFFMQLLRAHRKCLKYLKEIHLKIIDVWLKKITQIAQNSLTMKNDGGENMLLCFLAVSLWDNGHWAVAVPCDHLSCPLCCAFIHSHLVKVQKCVTEKVSKFISRLKIWKRFLTATSGLYMSCPGEPHKVQQGHAQGVVPELGQPRINTMIRDEWTEKS